MIAEELARLATILAGKADTSDAMAAEHALARNMDDWAKEIARAKSARHFVGILTEAAKKLKERAKRQGFARPSWEEVCALAKESYPTWPAEDVRGWFDHFESCGWKIGGGKPMADWRAALRNGFRNAKQRTPQLAPPRPATMTDQERELQANGFLPKKPKL